MSYLVTIGNPDLISDRDDPIMICATFDQASLAARLVEAWFERFREECEDADEFFAHYYQNFDAWQKLNPAPCGLDLSHFGTGDVVSFEEVPDWIDP